MQVGSSDGLLPCTRDLVLDRKSIGSRTFITHEFVQGLDIACKNGAFLKVFDILYSPLSGAIQGFSQNPVASSSAASKNGSLREITLLDPKNAPILDRHYKQFVEALPENGIDDESLLKKLCTYVRKKVFLSGNPETVKQIIKKKRDLYPQATHINNQENKIPLIPIDCFIDEHVGACRHHSLFCAYMIDRLITEKLLEGTVQHIRENIDRKRAHSWVVFIPKRKDNEPPGKWHVDSGWNVCSNFANFDGYIFLKKRGYGDAIDRQIVRTDENAEKMGQPIGKPEIESLESTCPYTDSDVDDTEDLALARKV